MSRLFKPPPSPPASPLVKSHMRAIEDEAKRNGLAFPSKIKESIQSSLTRYPAEKLVPENQGMIVKVMIASLRLKLQKLSIHEESPNPYKP